MLIEYEELIEQLKQFRAETIKLLAALRVEVDGLSNALVAKQPLLAEDLNRILTKSRERLGKLEEFYEHKLPLLHEKREDQ